jgi:hypothetical protein
MRVLHDAPRVQQLAGGRRCIALVVERTAERQHAGLPDSSSLDRASAFACDAALARLRFATVLGVVYAAAAFDWRFGVLVPVPLAGRDKARRLEATARRRTRSRPAGGSLGRGSSAGSPGRFAVHSDSSQAAAASATSPDAGHSRQKQDRRRRRRSSAHPRDTRARPHAGSTASVPWQRAGCDGQALAAICCTATGADAACGVADAGTA